MCRYSLNIVGHDVYMHMMAILVSTTTFRDRTRQYITLSWFLLHHGFTEAIVMGKSDGLLDLKFSGMRSLSLKRQHLPCNLASKW